MEHKKDFWWKRSVGYIIYPESFADGNGDGIGDIRGIISKLDYLSSLGVNLIWICPFFDSPMDDNGYDVRDYYKVNPRYGSNEDMKALIKEAHKRGIRLLFDFVLNHTSDEHEWFQLALADPSGKEAGYYYFRKGKREGDRLLPPNNWKGFFSTSAWERVGDSDLFYLHIFSKKMPDVNWNCPELRKRYYEIARYFLDLGVDGFRLDAVSHLGKDLSFEDSSKPVDADGMVLDTDRFSNREDMYTFLGMLKKEVFDHYDCLTLGECGGGISPEKSLRLTSKEEGYIDMAFNFDCSWCNGAFGSLGKKDSEIKTDVLALKSNFKKWFDKTRWETSSLPIYYCNHDHPRALSQYGSLKYRKESMKMLLLTLLFQYGTPFLHYGDEIGMSNVVYADVEDFYVDVSAKNEANYLRSLGYEDAEIVHHLCRTSRVNGRQPMQWENAVFAGFSKKKPSIKENPSYKEGVNVKEEENDPDSILNFAKKAIALRKQDWVYSDLEESDFILLDEKNPDVFAYAFDYEEDGHIVISNFRDTLAKAYIDAREYEIILSNYQGSNISDKVIYLRPFESILARRKKHG